jgi:hypothetical protein
MSSISPSLICHHQLKLFIRQQQVVVLNEQIQTGSHLCTGQSVDSVAFYTSYDWELKVPFHFTQNIPHFLV